MANRLHLAKCSSTIVVIVDGLGTYQLNEAKAHARFMSQLKNIDDVSTVFPSTTASALTSVVTGALPGEHGILGYRIRDPLSGAIINQLTEIGKTETTPWLLHPVLSQQSLNPDIPVTVIGHSRFATSPLTHVLYDGARYIAANSLDERINHAVESATTTGGLCLLYISELDEIAHKEGFHSISWTQRLENVDAAIKLLVSEISSETGVVITADHGIVDIPHSQHVLLGKEPVFTAITAWGGEPRCVQMYLTENEDPQVILNKLIALNLAHVSFYSREEIVKSNVLGNVDDDAIERLGDIFALAHDGYALYNVHDTTLSGRSMIGQHGGLSMQEMSIPCLVAGAYAP